MTEEQTAYKMLDNDNPLVQQVLKEAGVAPVSNKAPAKPAGSRKSIKPKVTEPDAALEAKIKEAEEPKELTITLSARDYALMLREAVGLNKPVAEHLQDVVAETLVKRLGKSTIKGASFMGVSKSVTSVTNSVRRQ